jgi:hypothetical protein
MIKRLLFLLAIFCCTSLALAQQGSGKRVALVIGNGSYKHIGKLSNPVNDADDIARALRGFGFKVMLYKDLETRQMREAIADFGRESSNAEAALFYFAGHGVQSKGRNYLIPVNSNARTEADFDYEAVNINYLLETLDDAKSRANIVMLDACRDNPFGGFRSGSRGLAPLGQTPKGTVIVYATDPGNTAEDGRGRNGTFTAAMLKAFKGSDLTLDGVLTQASMEVEKSTGNRQTPYVNGPKTLQKLFSFQQGQGVIQTAMVQPAVTPQPPVQPVQPVQPLQPIKPVSQQINTPAVPVNNSAQEQKLRPGNCPALVFDLVRGTVNEVAPTASQPEIIRRLPCATGSTEEGSTANNGGGVFFGKHEVYFYTLRDFIEVRRGFAGRLNPAIPQEADIEQRAQAIITQLKPKKIFVSNGTIFAEMPYGCLTSAKNGTVQAGYLSCEALAKFR